MHSSIFREYDIRGIVGESLHIEDARRIAQAFATKVKTAGPGAICVGRDGRLSSPDLVEAVIDGIRNTGMDVIDIGIGPTPMLYFSERTLNASAGIMITGSHNPASHNGFKFVHRHHAFYGQDIQGLRIIIEQAAFSSGKGHYRAHDICEDYLECLTKAYDGTRVLTTAWDAGNGATGEIMAALVKRLPGRHLLLNTVIDGNFPAHHPDPTISENLQQLIMTVKAGKLDCGIAFDGDGDRLGVIDNEGDILWGDQLLMLYATDILQTNPGAMIIADVKASDALFEEIARLGGKPLMWKTGHALIKSKMAETGALLAGEMSGHLFFADKYYGYDDALYAAVRLLGILSRSNMPLSELRKALPQRVNTPEIRFESDDIRKFVVISEVKERLQQQGSNFNDIDGVRVNTPDGWWLLRASNTQPMLVARCEALHNEGLKRLKQDLRKQLALSKVALP